ncbi:MAG: NAD(P)-dependent oxidoreductase [Anaerolineae bacterium]|nr:NAD(P)-dependent oxidoreductase [Anaerolineae bacterium]
MAELTKPTIGFIGLGAMGQPMALNLLRAGYPLVVYNRTPERSKALSAAGAQVANSPATVAHQAEIVITMVSDSAAVEIVILGDNGVIEGLQTGSVVIDMSTIAPKVTQKIAAKLAERDVAMLDAPVSGGVAGANGGSLSIMVGGEAAVVARCLPILQTLGQKITHVGAVGMGQNTKLCNQIVGMGTLAAVAEGLRFARASGLDVTQIIEVLGAGAAGSWQLANTGKLIDAQDWRPGFRVALALKDMRLALTEAEQLGLDLTGTETTTDMFERLVRSGAGELGVQALGAQELNEKGSPWTA